MTYEDKLSVNRQVLLTQADAQRLDWMAETEGRDRSEMMRILLLELCTDGSNRLRDGE
jgi:hypothetical protein